MHIRQTLGLLALASFMSIPTHADPSVDSRPIVHVENQSDSKITVHVDGMADVDVEARGNTEMRPAEGIVDFRARAVGIRPLSSTKVFLVGNTYTLHLWIDHAGLHTSASTMVTQSMRAQVTSLLAQVNAERADLTLAKRMIDDEEAEVNALGDRIQREKAEVDAQRKTVDKAAADDIDAYNLTADILDSDRARFREALDSYNDNVGAYNEKLTALKLKEKQLDDLADRINNG